MALRADADPMHAPSGMSSPTWCCTTRSQVPLPLWFEEGYAVYAAGEWDLLDALSLNYAVVGGVDAGPRFAQPGAARGHPAGISTAYALSASAVLELARRNPSRSLTPLVELLAAGMAFDSARAGHDRASRRRTSTRRGSEGVRTALQPVHLAGGRRGVGPAGAGADGWAPTGGAERDRGRRSALDEGWELPPEPEMQAAQALDPTPSGE